MTTISRVLMNKVVAEFVGTFAIVFAGCGAIMVSAQHPGSIAPNMVPVVFGLVVAAMIYSVGHISGAHFNPAVTLAFAIGKHFSRREILPYWLGQVSGAIVGSLVLSLLLPGATEFGATIPHASYLQALGWETVLSFFLMFVIVSVATDTRAVGTMAGTAIGATVTLGAIIGGPTSGASMNPARSLAPALFQGTLDGFWIYCVGPFAGAILAALLYNAIRCDEPTLSAETSVKEAKGCC